MIPEWVSFRNEFRSRMKFVLHSHYIIDRLNDRSVLHFENDTHAPLAPDYMVCVFILERSSFSLYMKPEWNIIPEREFRSDWKPEWTHSGMTCAGTRFRLGITYTDTEKYTGMEWTRSGMKVIPVSCKRPLRLWARDFYRVIVDEAEGRRRSLLRDVRNGQ